MFTKKVIHMRRLLPILAAVLLAAGAAAAQTEGDLKQHFEGQHVTLKIDLPATKDGVNVYPESERPLDFSEYAARLKRHGASIRRGDAAMITKIKVKGRHVEFQLDGGGYGTFGDETDAHVYVPSAEKSRREKRLEEELRHEDDPTRRRRLRDQIDSLRRDREREDRLNRAIAEQAEEERRARIEEKALRGGGRFNVHFTVLDSRALTPSAIREALRRYVDFSGAEEGDEESGLLRTAPPASEPRVVSAGPRTTFLKEGLREGEVLRLLGSPSLTLRAAGGASSVTHEFPRGEGRVLVAEFKDGVLVNSRTESRGQSAGAARLRSR